MKKVVLFGCSVVALGAGISSGANAQVVAGATEQATPQGSAAADATPQASADAQVSGDIIVTAQRREQSLLKVPVSISAISGADLQKAGISEATQLINSVPNLNLSGGYGRAQPNFYIRGIGAEVAIISVSSPVGVYIDDAYMSNRLNNAVQFFDVERVEVLRGPQGTLFGRNTVGGLINVISSKPRLDGVGGYVDASYGNYNTVQVDGALDTTLIPDKLGLRVAGTFSRNDGYLDNLVPGARQPLKGEDYGARATLLYKGDSGAKVLVKGYYGRYHHVQVGNIALGIGPNDVNPFATNAAHPTPYTRNGLDQDEVESDTQGRNYVRSYGLLATVSIPLSDSVTLSSLTSRDWADWNYLADVDGSPVRLIEEIDYPTTRQFNQEIKATIDLDRFNLVIGAYYGDDLVRYANGLNFGPSGFSKLLNQFLGTPAGGFSQFNAYDQERSSRALFAQGDYKLTDHLTVTVGARYTQDRLKIKNGLAYLATLDGTIFAYTVNGPTGPALPTLGRKDSAPTGRVALTYTTDDGHIFYASAGRGYRQGAFNGTIYSPATATFVKPEKVNAFELGSKGRLSGGLNYAVSGFYNKYTDQQQNDIQGAIVVLKNVGTAEIYGGELEVFGRVTPDLRFSGSLGLLHARYKDTVLENIDISGNQLPSAPDFNGKIGFDWTLPEMGGGVVTFSPAVSYRSKAYFSPFNDGPSSSTDTFTNRRIHQNGYALADASLTWEKGPLELRASVKNLFDKRYYNAGYNVRSLGFDVFNYGDPRLYRVSARYSF